MNQDKLDGLRVGGRMAFNSILHVAENTLFF